MPDKGFPLQSFTAILDSDYDGAVMTGMQWRVGPDGKAYAYPGSGESGGTVPSGTGFTHVTAGVQDGASKLVENADVAGAAAIGESKLALNHATHANTNDPTADQKAALAGTSGSPGDTNRFVTDADTRNTNSRTPTAHTHAASEVTDFSEAVDDRVSALLVAGSNITLTYNDGANTLTVAAAGGGGGSTWTEAEIDFGAVPAYDGQFTVSDGSVSGASKIIVLPSGKAATGRTADDGQWDGLILSATPGTGNFTLFAMAMPGPVVGKRTIQYSVAS